LCAIGQSSFGVAVRRRAGAGLVAVVSAAFALARLAFGADAGFAPALEGADALAFGVASDFSVDFRLDAVAISSIRTWVRADRWPVRRR
jgi:hypothetical protein